MPGLLASVEERNSIELCCNKEIINLKWRHASYPRTVRFHSLEPKDYLPFREFSFDKNIQQVLEYLDLPLQNLP